MAEVPREAVEFARLLVRAFYPPEFIVLTDAVLRQNNYIAHHDLARRLSMQSKELRQILVRMVQARIMLNEKRTQKRINYRDERRPARMISTEFWFVPLAHMIDAFTYRIHVIDKDIEERRQNELARQKYVCVRCRTEYQLLEILAYTTDHGEFQCPKMGVRPDRLPLPCKGIIKERDNSAQIKGTERLKHLMDVELGPLRERAFECSSLKIPVHPLLEADVETWGERVPETVGVFGEKVDEEGMSTALKVDVDGAAEKVVEEVEKEVVDNVPVPDKPEWFKERGADEEEEAWDHPEQHVLHNTTGTAASFEKDGDEEAYAKWYLEGIAGGSTKPVLPSKSSTPVDVLSRSNGGTNPTAQADVKASNAKESEDKLQDVMVSVGGKQVKLSEVTEEMKNSMTNVEYKAYFALANQNEGGGMDDDDDEFE